MSRSTIWRASRKDGRLDLLVFVHPLEEGHVTTATERPPVAGDHDHRAAGIPLQLQPDLGQTAVELRVGGIQGLGPVQPDDPDAITALDEKDGVRLAHASRRYTDHKSMSMS